MSAYKDSLIEQVYDESLLAAQTYNYMIDKQMLEIKNYTDSMVRSLAEVAQTEKDQVIYLRELYDKSSMSQNLFLINNHGLVIASASVPLSDLSEMAYFQRAILGESNFSDIEQSESDGQPITVYATPVYIGEEVTGVLAMVIELDFLGETVMKKLSGGEINAYIVDREGTVIAHPDQAIMSVEKSLVHLEPVQRLMKGEEGITRYIYEGYDQIASYVHMGITEWGLVVEEPVSKAFEDLYQLRRLMVWISLFSLVIILVVTMIIVKSINKPSQLLEHHMERIINGDLNTSIPESILRRKDEIGVYAVLQAKMLTSIKGLMWVNEERALRLTEQMSKHPVTKLINRYSLSEKMDAMIKEGDVGFTIMVVDIDGFKYINSNFGHETGNALLRIVSQIIVDRCPEAVCVAHLDADRFCLVINDPSVVALISAKLNESLGKIDYEGNVFALRGCSGIANWQEGLSGLEVLRNAEIALLQAKESGNGGYRLYEESYRNELRNRLGMMNQLKNASENKEIYMMYQPIYNTLNGHIEAYETLARWASPIYGNVPPNIFIEIAENTGYIGELGLYICQEAFKFANQVNKKMPLEKPIMVSINLSPRQLYQEGFLEVFSSLMTTYGVNPRSIAVEITENVYIENLGHAREVLNQLRAIGIKIYLDDFGTGYSSLSYIENLPIDTIKVDKSFVDKINGENRTQDMIAIVKGMADTLKLSMIAEGVETKAQVECLSGLGCHLIQGYYYSKPLHKEDILLDETPIHQRSMDMLAHMED